MKNMLCHIWRITLTRTSPEEDIPSDLNQNHEHPEPQEEPPKKKRKQAAWLVTVTGKLLCDSMWLNYNEILNAANKTTLYVDFKEQLISEGILKWRYGQSRQRCVMSDTNDDTGVLLPTSFVHVTATQDSTGEEFLTCTCCVYKRIQRSGKDEHPLWPVQEDIPDANLTHVYIADFTNNILWGLLTNYNSKTQNCLGPLEWYTIHSNTWTCYPVIRKCVTPGNNKVFC